MAQPVLFNGDAFSNAQDYVDENFGQELYIVDDVERGGTVPVEPGVDSDLVDEASEEEQAVAAAEAAKLELGWEPCQEGAEIVLGEDGATEVPSTEDPDQYSWAQKAAKQ